MWLQYYGKYEISLTCHQHLLHHAKVLLSVCEQRSEGIAAAQAFPQCWSEWSSPRAGHRTCLQLPDRHPVSSKVWPALATQKSMEEALTCMSLWDEAESRPCLVEEKQKVWAHVPHRFNLHPSWDTPLKALPNQCYCKEHPVDRCNGNHSVCFHCTSP